MAKMFYTLEEASEKLGLDAEAIKDMATEGKLQQFRDRDKLMFKREQVDTLAGVNDLSGASDSGIQLADPGPDDTDAISLADESHFGGAQAGDSMSGTGISVFDADEVEATDLMAQTQVTAPSVDDEELALESVGSGSGLLDLTRESDDTSLGAELLDEIYPGGDTGTGASIADFGMESSIGSSIGSSGVFDGAMSMETNASGESGLDNLAESDAGSMDLAGESAAGMEGMAIQPTASYAPEGFDPVGSALGTGLLIGAMTALLTTLVVMVAATMESRSVLVDLLVSNGSTMNVLYLCLGLAVLSGILGFVGMALARKSA
ncbi:MAG: helix-turn-helix domain-containing protein [Algisphaera sp.]